MAKPAKFNAIIETYINTKIGTIISPSDIIEAVQCTAPTAYAHIKNNSHRFEKISAGKYRVLAAVISTQYNAN